MNAPVQHLTCVIRWGFFFDVLLLLFFFLCSLALCSHLSMNVCCVWVLWPGRAKLQVCVYLYVISTYLFSLLTLRSSPMNSSCEIFANISRMCVFCCYCFHWFHCRRDRERKKISNQPKPNNSRFANDSEKNESSQPSKWVRRRRWLEKKMFNLKIVVRELSTQSKFSKCDSKNHNYLFRFWIFIVK